VAVASAGAYASHLHLAEECRQISTPASHHVSSLYGPDALPAPNKQRPSTEGTVYAGLTKVELQPLLTFTFPQFSRLFLSKPMSSISI